MKTIILALALVLLFSAGIAQAISCPAGQEVRSVLITPEVIAVPAVTHTVHHEAITHEETIIDTPAYSSYVHVGWGHGDYIKICDTYFPVQHNHGNYDLVHHPAVTHQETVIDTPAWDEEVIDVPAIIETPAVYEDQCFDLPPDPVTPPVVTSNQSSGSRSMGYMHPCGYLKVYSDLPCNYLDTEMRARFGWDENYRESILRPWRVIIFGG